MSSSALSSSDSFPSSNTAYAENRSKSSIQVLLNLTNRLSLAKSTQEQAAFDEAISLFGGQRAVVRHLYRHEEEKELRASLQNYSSSEHENVSFLQPLLRCQTLTVLHDLGTILHEQGRLEAAEATFKTLITQCEDHYGCKSVTRIVALDKLGHIFLDQGLHSEAQHIVAEITNASSEEFGLEGCIDLDCRDGLTDVLFCTRRFKEGRALKQETLRIRLQNEGMHHPGTLQCMADLGWALTREGRLKEGESLLEDVMRTRDRARPYEKHDIQPLKHRWMLAWNLLRQGRSKESELLFEAVLESQVHVLGFDHPDTLASMTGLMESLWRQDRLQDALDLQVRFMKCSKQGKTTFDTRRANP